MLRIITCSLLLCCSLIARAQPYFDPVSLNASHQPGIRGTGETSAGLGLALPVRLPGNVMMVFSPFIEKHDLGFPIHTDYRGLFSTGLPVTALFFRNDSSWVINTTVIVRNNADWFHFPGDGWQLGGVMLHTFKIREGFKLKGGLYYNREFFSDYFVPLAGIEYKFNPRLQLFGTIPNEMKLEYKFGKRFYGGVAYTSITNSYRMAEPGSYVKIQDNHIGLFADFYVTRKLVLMAEAGHTIMRSVRIRNAEYPFSRNGDSFIAKAALIYRVRFD